MRFELAGIAPDIAEASELDADVSGTYRPLCIDATRMRLSSSMMSVVR
jgi:hypothetical protein